MVLKNRRTQKNNINKRVQKRTKRKSLGKKTRKNLRKKRQNRKTRRRRFRGGAAIGYRSHRFDKALRNQEELRRQNDPLGYAIDKLLTSIAAGIYLSKFKKGKIEKGKEMLEKRIKMIVNSTIAMYDGVDIGQSFKISSIKLPENVNPTIQGRDFVIATVAAPTVFKEPEKPAEAEGAEGEAAAEGAVEGAEAKPAEGEEKAADDKKAKEETKKEDKASSDKK